MKMRKLNALNTIPVATFGRGCAYNDNECRIIGPSDYAPSLSNIAVNLFASCQRHYGSVIKTVS